MTTATAQVGAAQQSAVNYGSISRGRKRTLYWSYFFLILFVIFFLMPPVYMFITSLKTSAEIGAVTNPWWVYHPTLQNYIDLLSQAQFLTFFKNSALVAVIVVAVDGGQHSRRLLAGTHEVLGIGDFGDRRVPDVSHPGIAAVHPAVQDLRLYP